jgi:hypothetical protein
MAIAIQTIIGLLLVIWAIANIAKYITKGHPEVSFKEPEPEVIEEVKPIKKKRYYPKKKNTTKTTK